MAEGVSFRVTTGPEFRAVAQALREADASLPGKLRREIRQTVRPYIREVKRRVMAIPVHGRKHTGLRRRVASGVSVKVRTTGDANVSIVSTMRDPSEHSIPRGMDSPRGWRHPVFGNRDNWVTQHTGGSWFKQPLEAHRNDIKDHIGHVLEETARDVGHAG